MLIECIDRWSVIRRIKNFLYFFRDSYIKDFFINNFWNKLRKKNGLDSLSKLILDQAQGWAGTLLLKQSHSGDTFLLGHWIPLCTWADGARRTGTQAERRQEDAHKSWGVNTNHLPSLPWQAPSSRGMCFLPGCGFQSVAPKGKSGWQGTRSWKKVPGPHGGQSISTGPPIHPARLPLSCH